MTTSLIPERPLLISPTLAATIGLEEAVLLHVFSELLLLHPPIFRQQRRYCTITQIQLINALPFWELNDIIRVQESIVGMGLLLVEPMPGNEQAKLYAINQPDPQASTQATQTQKQPSSQVATSVPVKMSGHNSLQPNTAGIATNIPPDWKPDATLYQQCQQRNIPRNFVEQEVLSFVMYWRERQKSQYSWHQTFLNWIVAKWEKQRSFQGARELETALSSSWLPSEEAVTILEHAGISLGFIEDAVPEFVLYWRERGIVTSAWSSKFIAHVRRQWVRFTHALENDTTPRPIPNNFQPNDACFDVLTMANIDSDFAHSQVKEFVLYWQDRNEIYPSWNTKFLQHVKFQWAQRMQTSQPLLDKLVDRSWAD